MLKEREDGIIPLPPFRYINYEIDEIKKGKTEDYFYKALKNQLPYDIRNNLKIPAGIKYYYPDISIIAKGLFIDIEIDEPYSEDEGVPIHFLYSRYGISGSIDSERNLYLTKEGWEIIRFSEEQIVKKTQDCVDYIKIFIDSILEGNLTTPYPKESLLMNKWKEGEAAKMALNRYRDSYII